MNKQSQNNETLFKNFFKQRRNVFVANFVICIFVILIANQILFPAGLGHVQNLHGDLINYYAYIKGLSEHGFSSSLDTGFPFGTEWKLFPFKDFTVLPLVVGLSVLTNPIVAVNLFYLLSFPATYLLTFLVCRKISLNNVISFFISTWITFLPWHFIRIDHYNDGLLFPLLIGVWVVLAIFLQDNKNKLILAALIYLGMSDIHVSIFSILIVSGGCLASILFSGRTLFFKFLRYLFILCTVSLISLLPYVLIRKNAINYLGNYYERLSSESIYCAGSITRLFLPSPFSLNSFNPTNFPGEQIGKCSEYFSYGNFGTISTTLTMLVAIVLIIFNLRNSMKKKIKFNVSYFLAFIIFWLFLWFTPNLLGYLFAELISPNIRNWNRLSPYLIFLLTLLAARKIQEIILESQYRNKILLMVIFVFSAGTFIQIQDVFRFAQNTQEIKRYTSENKEYVSSIMELKGSLCGVLQLPVVQYPEGKVFGRYHDYDHFWPYLAESKFSGSYGVIAGTLEDNWRQSFSLDKLNSVSYLKLMKKAGICGVEIDKNAFNEIPAELQVFMRDKEVIESNYLNKIFIFLQKTQKVDSNSMIGSTPIFSSGFSGMETEDQNWWRWSTSKNNKVYFPGKRNELKSVVVTIENAPCSNNQIIVKNSGFERTYFLKPGQAITEQWSFKIDRSGLGLIEIYNNGSNCHSDTDTRNLRFRLINLRIVESNN